CAPKPTSASSFRASDGQDSDLHLTSPGKAKTSHAPPERGGRESRMRMRLLLLLVAALALSIGAGTASAGGGNSDAAQPCQKGGWQNLMREDGTGFKNEGDCVSYAAHGGMLRSCAGSENFSEFAEFSQPTTFSGGTIDTAYGPAGGIAVQGSFFNGDFPTGTHVLFSGLTLGSFQLTFTNPVGSLSLDAQDNLGGVATTITLTAYDSSNAVVASDHATDPDNSAVMLAVHSSSNNIDHFTVSTSDPQQFPFGVDFTNIVWACA